MAEKMLLNEDNKCKKQDATPMGWHNNVLLIQ